jgi:hypothetical protein
MNEWHFRLDGDEFDLKGVVDLFGSRVKITKDEQAKHHLVMELSYTTAESLEAYGHAEDLLARMNAIAQIVYGNHENVRIVGVGCKDRSGALMHLFIHMGEAIRSRARVGGNLTVGNSPGAADFSSPSIRIGDQFLAAADTSEDLERALYLFGSLPQNWRGLYMVLEAAKDGHGGWQALINHGWVRNGLIEDFRATANSYRVLGREARHGSVSSGIDKPRITLDEARDMVRTILEKWAKGSI